MTAKNLINRDRVKELLRDGGKKLLANPGEVNGGETRIDELGVDAHGFVINYLVEITPSIAADWMSRNVNNRKPSQRKIVRYAAMMKDDNFDLNGETIKFSKEGNLLDGQSRLRAIMSSGVTIIMEVRVGLPAKTQQTMDTGENRKLAHELEMNGYKNSNCLASALRLLYCYLQTKGSLDLNNLKRNHYFTNRQGLDLAEQHPGLHKTIQLCADPRLRKILPINSLAVLRYLFDIADQPHSESFFDEIRHGANLQNGDATLALRNRILTALQEGEPLPSKNRLILVLKAWKAHREGAIVTRLIAKKDEQIPEVDGAPLIRKISPSAPPKKKTKPMARPTKPVPKKDRRKR